MSISGLAKGLLYGIVAGAAAMASGEPFEPVVSRSIADPSRWNELEPLAAYKLKSGAEGLDGNLYFATDRSVVLYDGYQCREYPLFPDVPEQSIHCIFASQNGLLYALTSRGVVAFQNGRWQVSYNANQELSNARDGFSVSPFGAEVVTFDRKVYLIDGYRLERIEQIKDRASEASFDRSNKLWLVNQSGKTLVSYQFDRENLKRPLERREYSARPNRSGPLPRLIASRDSHRVWGLTGAAEVLARRYIPSADLWVDEDLSELGGDNSHITGFILSEGEIVVFTKTELLYNRDGAWRTLGYPDFNPPNSVPFIFSRRNGNLVIGGYGDKIHEIRLSNQSYEQYSGLHYQCDGDDGSRWFISLGGDVVQHDPEYGSWTKHSDKVIDTPLSIIKSADGLIWVAGAHESAAAVSYYNGKEWTRNEHPVLGPFISHQSAYQMRDGRLIFGAGGPKRGRGPGGVIAYTKENGGYSISHLADPLSKIRPVGFAETRAGHLWSGGVGLTRMDADFREPFASVPPFGSERWIDHLASDDEGRLWVALWERGLFQLEDGAWTQINSPDQIASNQIAFLLNDNSQTNALWAMTDKGLSRFDGSHWHPSALPSSVRFSREGGTLRQSGDGSLWVNVASRNWYFRRSAEFKITRDLLSNFGTTRHVLDKEAPAVAIVSPAAKLVAPANVFVEWSGVDRWSNTAADQLRFSYRLNDGAWSPFEARRNATLLDVPSGQHRVEVMALDLDGNVSPQFATTGVTVIPPVWKRPWFIALGLCSLGAFFALLTLLMRQRLRHALRMEEFKLQFFTNISHEIRTPLTVILGPLESHLARMPTGEDRGPLELAYKNARKILHLVDQLLDFRRAQRSESKLNLTDSDLVATVKDSVNMVAPLAEEKSQSVDFRSNRERCAARLDTEKLDRIVNNLVSNAIKYTQDGGSVGVALAIAEEAEDCAVEIAVEDNGCGIPRWTVPRVFDAFYRAANPGNASVRGSGIGLAYTKSLVEALGGSIAVESPVTVVDGKKQGTRFTVSLILRKSPPAEDRDDGSLPADAPRPHRTGEKPCLLIAEDDRDICAFLSAELGADYEVTTVGDGKLAWSEAKAKLPDIILSDVLMPRMDGKELCRRIKGDPRTSHIPVLMLSALKSERHELVGLECGADDYLSKPISVSILRQRLRNHLETRDAQHRRFRESGGEPIPIPSEMASNPLDERFLQQAVAFVDGRLDDPLLGVEALAQEMGMSRMTLYRKVKAVAGETPGNFIRTIRMKRALGLLQTGQYSVSEVGYKVGFSDLSSFSNTFKKQMGRPPSEFL